MRYQRIASTEYPSETLSMQKYLKNSITKMVFLTFGILGIPNMANAGLFGPDNYDECVLEKMKGQDKSLTFHAQNACEKKFPSPKEVYGYASELEYDWWSDNSKLYIKIKKNKGVYNVLRMSLRFTAMSCDGKNAGTGNTFSSYFEIKKDGSGEVAAKNANQYKCMSVADPMMVIMKK